MVYIAPDSHFYSIGKLSELLQASPGRIKRAADAAGIAPALRLNDVPYFADESIDTLRSKLQEVK